MSNYELEILVGGKPIQVYHHNGLHFVEGRRGSRYEIKVINNTWSRIEAVLSVDGLSVMRDGSASPSDSGYLIPSRSSIVIPGFRRNDDKVAEFVFSEKSNSYSAATGQGTENVGAIGLMVFVEKSYPVVFPTFPDISRDRYDAFPTGGNMSQQTFTPPSADRMKSMHATWSSSGMPQNSASNIASADLPTADSFELGTTWGNEKSHHVTQVHFNRENRNHPNEIITIYYDSRKALEARGIRVGGYKKKQSSQLPNPFPGYSTGCTPPPGWRNR